MNTLESIINLSLRGLSMGARFLLIFYLGKYFSLDDLGFYGLFFTTVTLALYVLGLDFYSYSNREILYIKKEDTLSVLRDQLLFYVVTYFVFSLPLLLIFSYGVLPFQYAVFFYVILILEHLSQELYRIFTILSFPIFSNVLLFLRSGIWIYLIILLWITVPTLDHSLTVIWWGWMVGAGLSVILGVVRLIRSYSGYGLRPIQLKWFLAGLKISLLYFGATISLKIIEFSSRYMIEYWCGIKTVGIFTFYNQVANMINVVIFTLFIMIVYPKLIPVVKQNNWSELNRLKKYLMKKILLYSIGLGLLLVMLIEPILHLINKKDFYEEVNTFYILIASNIILNVSLVYHYIVYAFQRDWMLFVVTTLGAVANILLNIVLIKNFGANGAAVSMLISYAILAVLKAWLARTSQSSVPHSVPSERLI